MEFEDIVRGLRRRMPWPVAKRVLKDLDLPRGQGWERTVDRLCHGDYATKANAAALEAALREHLLYGEKLVRFYHLKRGENAVAIDALQAAPVRRSILSRRYPEVLLEDDLADAPVAPALIAIEERDEAVYGVFGSVRSMMLRESVPTDRIPDEAKGILGRYDEVVGIKHLKYEAFDIVSISRSAPRVAVMVDAPVGMHKDDGEAAHIVLQRQLEQVLGDDLMSKPVNLFPLINTMYRARNEGIVVELAFGTSTASLKHEKMRRQSLCLRQEAYHQGGKAALGTPIEPHRLSIIWGRSLPSGGNSMPEMSLHTTAAVAGAQHPVLFDVEIRKCMGADDFLFVCERMEHFLSQQKR